MPRKTSKQRNDSCPRISIGSGDARISLKDVLQTKPVVLIFYSGDFSPQAITLLKRFATEYGSYQSAGFDLYAVGSGNEKTRLAFTKKYALPFPLLHDVKKSAAKAFGVTKKIGNKLLIEPHVFVVNTKGTICFAKKGYPKCSEILKCCE